MRGTFDDEEFDPARSGRDTELTLGPIMLLGLFLGLVLLCILCFSLGYAVGHRGHVNPAVTSLPPADGVPALSQAAGSSSKPSAITQTHPQQRAAVDVPQATALDTNPAASSQTADAAAVAPAVQPQQVRPALPPQSNAPQPGSGVQVQPALSQAPALMVQIAAVSHDEDARVLMNALRKRGYAVTTRREPSDGLIHVQIGPFTNRNQADAMCQKLLNDGYNAIVHP